MHKGIPSALLASLAGKPGIDLSAFIGIHEKSEPLTSIRINPAKAVKHPLQNEAVAWSQQGYYLKERPSFTADPLFHAGCYYVQEASSMFLEQALKQSVNLNETLRVLDLCAAPGGKSTLISSLINEESLLLANEIIKSRVPILADNLSKWGKPNTYVSNNDPRDFGRLADYFDVMVVDAPCSGSGMFRKDPDAIEEWSEDAVNLCSQRQKRILADAYPALKQGGILIYSTCSYSEAENEAIADWLYNTFELESIRLTIEPEWGIVETQSPEAKNWGYRFYPSRLKGEGFFLTCFLKKDGNASPVIRTRKQEPQKIPAAQLTEINNWIHPDADLGIKPFQDGFLAIPKNQEQDLIIFQENLYLKKSGTRLGKFAGKDFIPEHELALSILVAPDIPKLSLNREQALAYLKRMDFQAEHQLNGWVLVTYEDFALGWAKVLPKRINNYYPKEQRIVNPDIR